MTDDEIKEICLANGFEIKPGCDDLKQHVYAAARALLYRAGEQGVFRRGDLVRKRKGSAWEGRVVGKYWVFNISSFNSTRVKEVS